MIIHTLADLKPNGTAPITHDGTIDAVWVKFGAPYENNSDVRIGGGTANQDRGIPLARDQQMEFPLLATGTYHLADIHIYTDDSNDAVAVLYGV